MEITTESPLLPWLVRHCGWILSRYAVRADGRTGYSRLKGREYTAGTAIFGEVVSRDSLRFGWGSRTVAMSTPSDWKLEQYLHDQFDGRSKESAGNGHWNALESSSRRSGGETTTHHTKLWWRDTVQPKTARQACFRRESATLRAMSGTIWATVRRRGGPSRGQSPGGAASSTRSSSTESHLNVNGSTDRWSLHGRDGVSSQAHATAAPIRPFVTGDDETKEH